MNTFYAVVCFSLALSTTTLCSLSEPATAGESSWIADKNQAEGSLNKNDLVAARTKLTVSLKKALALPAPDPKSKHSAWEKQINHLDADFVKLWVCELRNVLEKTSKLPSGDAGELRNTFSQQISQDAKVLLVLTEAQLGKQAAELGQIKNSAANIQQVLKNSGQQYKGTAVPDFRSAIPGLAPQKQ